MTIRPAPAPPAAPPGEPPLEELVGLFFRVLGAMRQHFTDRSAEFDLTFPQAMALRELDQPVPMRQLAERLCCDASNVTGIVDRLESRGLVERQVSATDRRVKHLVLTDAGRALRAAHHQRLTDGVPLVNGLSPAERVVLANLLRRAAP
ncbi:MAG: MarR family winged helix-turn-helix transcriptional regulator [Acidimicrobiales bacterium]